MSRRIFSAVALCAVLALSFSVNASQILLRGVGGNGGVAIAPPTVLSSDFTATDGAGVEFNQSTISMTVSGANPMLLMCGQLEFGDSSGLFWYATYNGILGSNFFLTDGYAEPKTLVCYYWIGSSITAGTHDLVTTKGVRDVPDTGGQEMTIAAVVFNGVAQVTYPFRGTEKDIDAGNRSAETETCTSAVGDLVIHVMATSLFTPGTPGAGETIVINAQDGTDDASLLITKKAGAATSTTVSSSGWAGTFPLQGLCMSIMPAGTVEPLTIYTDLFQRANENPLSNGGTWTAPAGAAVGAVALVSNIATGSGLIEDIAQIATPSFNANQRIQCTMAPGAGGTFVRLWARSSDSGGYMLTPANAGTLQIYAVPNNGTIFTYNKLGADYSSPFNFIEGDVLEIQISGDTITTYWDGLPFATRAGGSAFAFGQLGIGSFGAIPGWSKCFASTLPVRN